MNVNTPGRSPRSVPAMVAGFAPRARAQRWITSWLRVTRLRPGRSGRSARDVMSWDDPIDRLDAGPRVGAACARAGADFARDEVAPARAGVAFAREGTAPARAAVAFARAGAALRVPVALARAPAARVAGAALAAEVAFRRAGAVFRAAVFFAAVVFFAAAGRPAGPVLRRAAPPRPSARMVRASVFTSSGLRSVEVPETPRRRSWPRMSSTFIREISDSDTFGVFGVRLPVCRLVRVAVVPRPELLR
ncbi:hypothetical protein TPA0908_30480 [Micromonospora sp. AKA38]|nr:hypothetical protein TPA0908_30480 [Micromonospora sp. AKA38]